MRMASKLTMVLAAFAGGAMVASAAFAAPGDKSPVGAPVKGNAPVVTVPSSSMKGAGSDRTSGFGLPSQMKPGLMAGAVPQPPKGQTPSRFESVGIAGSVSCAENFKVAVKIRAGSAGGPHTVVVGVLRTASFGPGAVAAFETTVDVPANDVREAVLETPLRPTCLSDGNLDPRLLVIQVGGSSRVSGPPGPFGAPTTIEVPMAMQTLVPRTATMAVTTSAL